MAWVLDYMLKYFNSLGLLPLLPNFMKDLGAMSSNKINIFSLTQFPVLKHAIGALVKSHSQSEGEIEVGHRRQTYPGFSGTLINKNSYFNVGLLYSSCIRSLQPQNIPIIQLLLYSSKYSRYIYSFNSTCSESICVPAPEIICWTTLSPVLLYLILYSRVWGEQRWQNWGLRWSNLSTFIQPIHRWKSQEWILFLLEMMLLKVTLQISWTPTAYM